MIKIGIPTHNNLRYLKETIESIKTKEEFRVLVIDNGSTDETKDYLKSLEDYNSNLYEYISYNTNKGVSKAWNDIINWGFSSNNVDCVFILNNDLHLHENCIDNMVETIKTQRFTFVSACPIGGSVSQLSTFERPIIRYTPYISFACFALTWNTIKRVGLFDEGFSIAYYEDIDYLWRMRQEGIARCTDNWAYTVHYGSRTIKEGGFNHEPHFSNNRKYFKEKWNFDPEDIGKLI